MLLLLHIGSAHLGIFGFLKELFCLQCTINTMVFCTAYDYVEKVDLSKGYQNPKRKLGVTIETIELKFGRQMPYTLYFKAFLE